MVIEAFHLEACNAVIAPGFLSGVARSIGAVGAEVAAVVDSAALIATTAPTSGSGPQEPDGPSSVTVRRWALLLLVIIIIGGTCLTVLTAMWRVRMARIRGGVKRSKDNKPVDPWFESGQRLRVPDDTDEIDADPDASHERTDTPG